MKKVSIVIPCYNAVEYLDCCMDHILRQTIGINNIEIILVDDASTDDGATLKAILEYERKFPDTIIAVPLEQNLRQGGARNVGISYASGEYLMFCDADDWLAFEAMEVLYNVAREYDADVVEFGSKDVTDNKNPQSRMECENGEIKISMLKMESKEEKKQQLLNSTDFFTLGCWNKFYRLPLIRDNNIRFVEHLICEEPSFTVPVRLYEKKHFFVDAVLHFCFLSPNSTMRSNWDKRKWDNAEAWLLLMEDLEARGFLQEYHEELECMFFVWGFGLTIEMLIKKGYRLTKNEMAVLRDMVLNLFPNVEKNSYIREREEKWDALLMAILTLEFTDENVQKLNQMMVQILCN